MWSPTAEMHQDKNTRSASGFRNVYVGFVIMAVGRGEGDWRKPGTGGMFVIGWGRVHLDRLGGLLAWVSGIHGIPSFPPRALSKIQRFIQSSASFLTPLTFPSSSNTDYNYTMSVSSGEDTAPANSSPSTPEMRLTVPNPVRKTKRRIAVLTSGGDSAGMNAAGKSTLLAQQTSNALLDSPAAWCAGDRARVPPAPCCRGVLC